jgi:hypothetical protein
VLVAYGAASAEMQATAQVHAIAHLMGAEDAPAAATVYESDHPYTNNLSVLKHVVVAGARRLCIEFDERCRTEANCDLLQFFADREKQRRLADPFSGEPPWRERFKPFSIEGAEFWYSFTSDGSNTDWGYAFTVVPEFTEDPAAASAARGLWCADLACEMAEAADGGPQALRPEVAGLLVGHLGATCADAAPTLLRFARLRPNWDWLVPRLALRDLLKDAAPRGRALLADLLLALSRRGGDAPGSGAASEPGEQHTAIASAALPAVQRGVAYVHGRVVNCCGVETLVPFDGDSAHFVLFGDAEVGVQEGPRCTLTCGGEVDPALPALWRSEVPHVQNGVTVRIFAGCATTAEGEAGSCGGDDRPAVVVFETPMGTTAVEVRAGRAGPLRLSQDRLVAVHAKPVGEAPWSA